MLAINRSTLLRTVNKYAEKGEFWMRLHYNVRKRTNIPEKNTDDRNFWWYEDLDQHRAARMSDQTLAPDRPLFDPGSPTSRIAHFA